MANKKALLKPNSVKEARNVVSRRLNSRTRKQGKCLFLKMETCRFHCLTGFGLNPRITAVLLSRYGRRPRLKGPQSPADRVKASDEARWTAGQLLETDSTVARFLFFFLQMTSRVGVVINVL